MKRIDEIFAENLRRLRRKRQLSQQSLAEKIGVSVMTIQNYEALRRWPSAESIHDLAVALEVREADFFKEVDRVEKSFSPNEVLWAVSEALGISEKNETTQKKQSSKKKPKSD